MNDTSTAGPSEKRDERVAGEYGVRRAVTTNATTNDTYYFGSEIISFNFYGWRKRCLFGLMLGLIILTIANLALTLWILKLLEFTTDGMGPLKMIKGGIQLSGEAIVLDSLRASSIRSRHGKPIAIESNRNMTVTVIDKDGYLVNQIFLDPDKFECFVKKFRILDEREGEIFSITKDELLIGAEMLRVFGVGGIVVKGSVQTPLIRAESAHDLKLESPTRSLEITAPISVSFEARAGNIVASSLKNLNFKSIAGAIRFEASQLVMPQLVTARRQTTVRNAHGKDGAPAQSQTNQAIIYQVCTCSNGKLFLASSQGACYTDNDTSVCR